MTKAKPQYSPEVKERAIRMVLKHQHQYALPWPAIESITPKIGCAAATLHEWVKRHQIDFGKRDGINTDERERIKKLEQKNKAQRCANEKLKLASAFLPKRGKAANSNKLTRLKKLSIIATESSQFTTSCRLALQTIGIMLLDVCN